MVTIYNVATGKPKTLDMVDAREHVASGRWGFGLPEPVPVVDTTSTEPVQAVEVVDTTSPEAYDERLVAFNAAMQTAEATPQVQAVAKAKAKK